MLCVLCVFRTVLSACVVVVIRWFISYLDCFRYGVGKSFTLGVFFEAIEKLPLTLTSIIIMSVKDFVELVNCFG